MAAASLQEGARQLVEDVAGVALQARDLPALASAVEREMARLGLGDGTQYLQHLAADYIAALMAALKRPATPRQHVNVLQHLLGYLKEHLDKLDREEMTETIEQYRRGLLPLIVPVTLIRHHFRRYPDPYVMRQYYLSPHPKELMLRNRI